MCGVHHSSGKFKSSFIKKYFLFPSTMERQMITAAVLFLKYTLGSAFQNICFVFVDKELGVSYQPCGLTYV